jgi:hypothetical protein
VGTSQARPITQEVADTGNCSPESPEPALRHCFLYCFPFALLFAASIVAAQQPADPQDQQPSPGRVTVHGTVRNAATGAALARALVQIEGDAETGALTNGDGQFEITGVPLGPQVLRVAKPGFRDQSYATEESGLESEGPAHSVMVAAGMPELNFALAPNCAIHGRIELSTGDPADGISVDLFRRVVRFGRGVWVHETTAKANGDGVYRFGNLPDGVYVVATEPALESEPAVSVVAAGSAANIARNGYASVYYPDARDFASAQRIRISAGAQAEANFTLALEPFYPVTTSNGPAASRAQTASSSSTSGYTAVISDPSGHPLPYTAEYDDTTRSLQTNLPDGTYILTVRGFQQQPFSGGLISFFGRDGRGSAQAGSVTFTVSGHPLTGLRFPMGSPTPAVVHLNVVHGGDGPANAAFGASNTAEVVVLSLDVANGPPVTNGENIWSMDYGADSIGVTAQPGGYWVSASLPQRGVCASSFTAGGVNLAREPLVLSLTVAPPPMELTLRDDCAKLTLTLPSGLATFLPGEEPMYTVYVVPDFDTVQDLPPMAVHPSSGATLTVDGLTPGSYHVYTFTTPVHLEYRDPTAMAALSTAGQQVTLEAGTTATLTLEVPEK